MGTSTPDSSAQLDVFSLNKGFLPPRVALLTIDNPLPITKPATGLLVYNTATSGASPINVRPGYYYWNGTSWYPVVNKGYTPGEMQYWDGSRWVIIPLGLNGQKLTICNGIPRWGNCPADSIVISPAYNPTEGTIATTYPNSPGGTDTEFPIQAWTVNGNSLVQRSVMKQDLSGLPSGAIIDSAKLYLYAMPEPHGGNLVDAHFGSNNACWIQRITSPWIGGGNPFTWNAPPSVTTTNQVAIPQSTSSFQNNVLDVTNLVRDLISNGNNGIMIRLQSETAYNIRQFASAWYSDPTKRPKLVIYYRF
ncbi:MAG: DNRLRE domain-containing protein [Chitinophagaceae bacterium]